MANQWICSVWRMNEFIWGTNFNLLQSAGYKVQNDFFPSHNSALNPAVDEDFGKWGGDVYGQRAQDQHASLWLRLLPWDQPIVCVAPSQTAAPHRPVGAGEEENEGRWRVTSGVSLNTRYLQQEGRRGVGAGHGFGHGWTDAVQLLYLTCPHLSETAAVSVHSHTRWPRAVHAEPQIRVATQRPENKNTLESLLHNDTKSNSEFIWSVNNNLSKDKMPKN